MARKVIGPTGSRRRRWVFLLGLVVAIATGVFFIAGAGAVTGSPSGFESADGNMVLNDTSSGNATDWNCFVSYDDFQSGTPHPKCAITGSSNPDAEQVTADPNGEITWVNGQKFDTQCPALQTGNVPNKDDFTHIASYTEIASNFDVFFYGATIRQSANGNASGDVEFNQDSGDGTTTAGCRTWNDRLVAYDFLNGGTGIDFHVLTWIDNSVPGTSDIAGGNSGTCYVKTDSMPCWGANVIHPVSGDAFDGQSNQSAITATNNGISGEALAINQFAEFGVNLSKALDLGSSCQSFPQQVWETRTSGSSFSSNPEDIEFTNLEVSNCGSIKIVKNTTPSGQDQVFSYTSDLPEDSGAGGVNASPCSAAGVDSSGNFCLNAKDSTSNNVYENALLAGTYNVTEGDSPTGYSFDSVSCKNNGSDVSSGSGGLTISDKHVQIALAPGDTWVCTYVNKALGEIKIIKHTDPRGVDQVFSYTSGSGSANGLGTDTNAGGVACSQGGDSGVTSGAFCLNDSGNSSSDNTANTLDVKDLPLGDYNVTETLPDNWTLGSLSCSDDGSSGSSGSQDGTTDTQANITLKAGGVVTCTYKNEAPGEIKIIKHTDPRGIDQVFSYTSNLGTDSSAGGVSASPCSAAGVLSGAFCLNDSGNTTSDNTANTLDVKDLAVGSYNVTETLPTGWTLEGLTCSTGGSQDGTTDTKANITLAAGATVTCTYQNKAPSGAIVITKESSKTAATALSGAKFQVCTNNGPYDAQNPCTAPDGVTNPVGPSGSDGKVCVDGLFWNGLGTHYYVQETKAPDGYSIDKTTAKDVIVDANASCTDTTNAAAFTMFDTPLTTLEVIATSEATGGTKSKISCVDSSPATVGTSITTFTDPADWKTEHLTPDTYICTVIIDP
jgi:hypothetical protein